MKEKISASIKEFSTSDLTENSLNFFKTLGYESERQQPLDDKTFDDFNDRFITEDANFDETKALTDDWNYVDFLFQLTEDELNGQISHEVDERITSYLFFTIELEDKEYSRTNLSEITRQVNKLFSIPAMILFKYGNLLTLSIIDRRPNMKVPEKDVLKKVTLIKDINIEKPHRGHIEILNDLALDNLSNKFNIHTFLDLHEAWRKVLDTKELNKSFFQKLANWYFWAVNEVTFPVGDESETEEVRNATSIIRLITRLMFVWFLKEKGLVSDKLFDEEHLREILNFKDDSTFYKAILQNLFFATLNSEMGKRDFIKKGSSFGNTQHFVHNVFRYKDEFVTPDETIKELFEPIPFLNGGLFECLDKEIEVEGSDKKKKVRVDGFSQHKNNPLSVPDELFFGKEQNVDLNDVFGTNNKTYKAQGLINLLNGYKFTVTENTPIEEEIALDPELLGKVFENLLANYNPETKTTARKQTGSFYTPREIVNYMVDESLIAYLKSKLETETEGFSGYIAFGENQATLYGNEARIQPKFEETISGNRWHGKSEKLETALRELFSYSEVEHEFNETETEILIKAIDDCKILDPACGSGAFPMGVLLKLVHILEKLDTDNEKWKEWQRRKAVKETEEAYKIGDHKEREDRLLEINKIFEDNSSDYGRKLFLIENCIYGVDIQPIAIQIAKLRFFISLIVDQNPAVQSPNFSLSASEAGRSGHAEAWTLNGNRGIRPLPNLETKFVAANTLIGLETNGGLKPNGVPALEAELKEVRAKHFNARTRQTKEKYRKRDLEIRTEIADLLKQTGFPETSANQISDWNPYDQNFTAEWFDAEWMFGIEKGFDIVIGNPPYVISKDKRLRKIYRESVFGRPNLYGFFIHQGLQHSLAKNGLLTFINPRTLLTDAYFSALRKFINKNYSVELILNVIDRRNVFESVLQSCIVNIFRNKEQSKLLRVKTIQTKKDIKKDNELKVDYSAFFFGETDKPLFLVAENKIAYDLMKKVNSLNTFQKVGIEFTTGKIQWDLYSQDLSANQKSDSTKLIWAENIQRYYFAPARNRADKLYINTNLRTCQPINHDTIVVQRTTAVEQEFRIISMIVSPNDYGLPIQAENNTSYLVSNNGNDLKVILAILGSRFADYFFRLINSNTHVSAGELNELPFPKINKEQQTEIAEIVDKIIEAKKQDANADTKELEAEIDCLVYQLYDLTDEEIAIVEGKE